MIGWFCASFKHGGLTSHSNSYILSKVIMLPLCAYLMVHPKEPICFTGRLSVYAKSFHLLLCLKWYGKRERNDVPKIRTSISELYHCWVLISTKSWLLKSYWHQHYVDINIMLIPTLCWYQHHVDINIEKYIYKNVI